MANRTLFDSQNTTERLLDSAFDLFARHGFANTAMTDIAAASGISRSLLLDRFESKEMLFEVLAKRTNALIREAVIDAARRPGSLDERLQAVLNARIGWISDLRHKYEFGYELIDEQNPLCCRHVIAVNQHFNELIHWLIYGGEDCKDPKTAEASDAFMGTINRILLEVDSKEDATQRIAMITQYFVQNLRN